MNPEKPKRRHKNAQQVQRLILSGLWALPTLLLALQPVRGQELKRDLPIRPCSSQASPLDAAATPSEADRQEASRLSSEANEAAILGDLEGAIERLQEAAELDPLASEVAYRLARILEDAGQPEAALGEFCRYLGLEPDRRSRRASRPSTGGRMMTRRSTSREPS